MFENVVSLHPINRTGSFLPTLPMSGKMGKGLILFLFTLCNRTALKIQAVKQS